MEGKTVGGDKLILDKNASSMKVLWKPKRPEKYSKIILANQLFGCNRLDVDE